MEVSINSPLFSDISLQLETKALRAHRIILSRSTFIKSMFTNSLQKFNQKKVNLELILIGFTFIYTNNLIQITIHSIIELLGMVIVLEYLELDGLSILVDRDLNFIHARTKIIVYSKLLK